MNIISSDGSIAVSQQDCQIDLKAKPPIKGLNTGPSPSFLFSGNGASLPLIGSVRLSGQSGNTLIINPDGLYSPISTFTESLINAIDTPTIDFTITGPSAHTIKADLKVSSATGNSLIIRSDGVYVPNNGGSGSYTDAQARNSISGQAPIIYNKVTGVISIGQANASNSGYLSSTDWITFMSKEPAVPLGTTAQYYRGDKTWQTLNTTVVSEGLNQYFTQVRARASISATAPINYNSITGIISETLASTSSDGYLSSSDYSLFSSKVGDGISLASVNALSVYKDKLGSTLEFRGVRAGLGITLALAGDDIVINAQGVIPAVNAGADKSVTLPTTSVSMTGSASTSQGTIVSTTWLFLSGPNSYIISDASSPLTTITNLAAGTYTFRLLGVNTFGLSNTDDVIINVAGSVTPTDIVYIGVNITGLTPTEADILAAVSSSQNGAFDVSADWTTLSAAGPVFCFFAIPDNSAAYEKNQWFVNNINKGNIGTPDDLFGALTTVTVSSQVYSVGITNYVTQFDSVCLLKKV